MSATFPNPAQAHFLADENATVLEIYCNPSDEVPDYRNMVPLLFHLALASADPVAEAARLVSAGAVVEEIRLPDGSHLVMLRDPWELALQPCKRARSLFADLPTAKACG